MQIRSQVFIFIVFVFRYSFQLSQGRFDDTALWLFASCAQVLTQPDNYVWLPLTCDMKCLCTIVLKSAARFICCFSIFLVFRAFLIHIDYSCTFYFIAHELIHLEYREYSSIKSSLHGTLSLPHHCRFGDLMQVTGVGWMLHLFQIRLFFHAVE